jgi:hypothetical protein
MESHVKRGLGLLGFWRIVFGGGEQEFQQEDMKRMKDMNLKFFHVSHLLHVFLLEFVPMQETRRA